MKKVASIGGLLKKIYRVYSQKLLMLLEAKGFTDLRPSFLEVLKFTSENDGPSIRTIGDALGLKKQTMTSHLNELEKRGYIVRKQNEVDRRAQNVFLTEYGEKFKFALGQCTEVVEKHYVDTVGLVELERIEHALQKFYQKIKPS
ncbi:MAG: MarR family transcriptional regulator [Bdellovibrionota bacterium]